MMKGLEWRLNPYLGRMNTDKNRCTIGLFPLDPFDVQDKFLSVTLDNLPDLLTLVVSTNDLKEWCNFCYFQDPIDTTWNTCRDIESKLTCTSSSFLTGMDLTPYFVLSSLDNGADMIRRRMWEGALKCFFLATRREPDTSLFIFAILELKLGKSNSHSNHSLDLLYLYT